MPKENNFMGPVTKADGNKKITAVIVVLCLALVVAVGAAIYFYSQVTQLKQNPQISAQQQVQAIVAKVSRLILLPKGETPTIATVTDPSLLKGQAFFSSAKKGDQVLIYTTAKKAILYDPVADKIVDVAPVTIGNTPATTVPAAGTTPTTNNTAGK